MSFRLFVFLVLVLPAVVSCGESGKDLNRSASASAKSGSNGPVVNGSSMEAMKESLRTIEASLDNQKLLQHQLSMVVIANFAHKSTKDYEKFMLDSLNGKNAEEIIALAKSLGELNQALGM